MKTYFPFEREDGTRDMVAAEDIEAYRRSFPNAQQFKAFELPGGRGRTMVRQSDWDAFAGAEPDAKEYYFAETGKGERFEVAKDDFRAFLDSENPATSGTPVRDFFEGALDAATPHWNSDEEVEALRRRVVDLDRRAKQGTQLGYGIQDAGIRLISAPAKIAGAVADLVNPDPLRRRSIVTGEVERLPPEAAGFKEDPYSPGWAAQLRDWTEKKEAERAAATAPETGAGRFARGVGATVGNVAALMLSGGAAGPIIAGETGVSAMERADAKGADAADRAAALAEGTLLGAGALAVPIPGVGAAGQAVARTAGRTAARVAMRPGAAWNAGGVAEAANSAIQIAGRATAGGIEGAARMGALQAAENVAAGDPVTQGVGGAMLGGGLFGAGAGAVSGIRAAAATKAAARQVGWDAARRAGMPKPGPNENRLLEEGVPSAPPAPPEPPPIDVEGRVVATEAGNRGHVVAGPDTPPPPALPPGENTPPTVGGQPRVFVPATPGSDVPPQFRLPASDNPRLAPDQSALPDPALTPEQAALPTTPEQLDAARAAALAQRPLRERMRDTSLAAYQAEHPTPALEAIGADNFRALARKYKGDFRDVTGDPFDVLEVAQQAGRPDLAQDPQGAAKLLQAAADELAGYRAWKERGAPTLEQETTGGMEIAANRAEQAEARERHAARLASETEPAPPPEEQRALAAGADAAAEDAFIAEMEGGEPAEPAEPVPAQSERIAELEARRVELERRYQTLLAVPQTDANARAFSAVIKEHDAVVAELANLRTPAEPVPEPTPQRRGALERAIENETPEETAQRQARETPRLGQDRQGNPINPDGSLLVEKVERIEDISDNDFTKPVRNVSLPDLPQNVADAIGSAGRPVVIKKNIFGKNAKNHPDLTSEASREILSKALYNPNLVGQSQPKTRPNYKVVIHTEDKNAVAVLDVHQTRDRVEVVGWHYIRERQLEQLKRQAAREDGQLLILSPSREGPAAGLSTLPHGSAEQIQPQSAPQVKPEIAPGSRVVVQGELAGIRFPAEVVSVEGDNVRIRQQSPLVPMGGEKVEMVERVVPASRIIRPDEGEAAAPAAADEVWINGEKTTRDKLTPRGAALLEKAQSLVGRTFRHDNGDGKAFTLEVLGITPKGNVKVRQRWTDENGKPIPELDRDFVQFMSWTEDFGGKDFPEVKPAEPAQDAAALQAAFDQAYNSWAMAEQIVEGREMRGEDTTEAKARAAALYEQMSAAQRALAAAKQPAEPAPLVLDGGTPAELAAEKARAAQKAGIEQGLARELGGGPAPTIQEGLPGLGGDGTLFTPPPGGWGGGKGGGFADEDAREPSMLDRAAAGEPIAAEKASRASRPVRGSSGSVMADLGAADGEGARSKRSREDAELVTAALEALRRNWDGAGNVDELRDFASKLEARSLYGSAAKLKRAAGEPAPRPGLSTEGAHAIWPTQEPGVSRVALHELAELALSLGAGRAPGVAQRLRGLQGRALGYYMPLGRGSIMLKANLFQLVDADERMRIRREILGSGGDEKDVRAAIAERVRENMLDDAPKAAQVLAHEIGHWIDDLPELGMLRGRGNVLGHIASLKHFLAKTIFLDPKKAREWGADEEAPGLDPNEREKIAREALKGVKRKDFASDEEFKAAQKRARREAIENALAERGLAEYPQVRGEMDDLIAWYRQSDHAPDYYQQPWEMFAEAFSAWLYYPRTAAAKAPTFAKLLEAWGPKKGEAWERVRAIQRREPAFDGVAGSVGGGFLERFKERMRAATLAHYKLAGYRVPDLAQGGGRAAWQDWIGSALTTFWGELRWVDHAARMLEKERTGAVREGGWGTPEGAAALGSVHEYTAASAMAEEELRRFQTEVGPLLEQGGATYTDLDVYMTLFRVSKEVLGTESQGGRANLANPNGLTPGSARGLLDRWRRSDPATFDTVKRAQELFARIRRETVLPFARKNAGISEAAMEEMQNNDAYARFQALFAPRVARAPAARGEMRAGTGFRHQKTGFLAQNISPILATLMGDGQIYFDSALNGARRDAVRLLAAAFPEAVRVTPMHWDPEAQALVPNQTNGGGWRTVVFRELDDKGQSRVVGYDLRDWAAYGLRGVEKAAPGPWGRFLNRLNTIARMNARAVTSLSWGFSLLNPFRDVSGMRRNLPAGPDAGAGQRWFGSLGASFRAFTNGAGAAREKGEPHALLDEALAAGAMPGGTFDHRAFSHRAADALYRYYLAGSDEREAIAAADDVVRSLDIDSKLVFAQENFWRRIGGAIEKVWGALPRRLGRMETNVKAQAWAEVRRAHPDWDPRRAAEFVARYTGTPSPQAPSAIAQIPGFRLVSLFYTMVTRGIGDQIFGAARQQPGIMGRRLLSHVALRQLLNNSWWWLIGTGGAAGGLVGWLRRQAAPADGDDEDESFYKRGLAETADALEWFANAQRSMSPFDKQQAYCLPLFTVDEKTGKYAYLKNPYDQSFYIVDALADYAMSELTGMHNFTAAAMSDTVAGGAIPSAGPALRQLVMAFTGEDIGQGGRSIHRNDDYGWFEGKWDHLAAAWDIWTGRGWGVLPARGNVFGTMFDDRKTALEKFLSIPGIVNTLRPFLRVSNQGDAETARMIRSWAAENERKARRAATAIGRDEEPEAEDRDTLETYTADPQGMIERAMQRDWEERNKTPTERALEAIPRRMRDDARERFGLP